MQPASVLIVDDHALFRQGVRGAIQGQPDLCVVGEAADGKEALARATELRPDLILMDISMPGCNGLETIRAIKHELPQTKVVMLTVHEDDESLFEAVVGGAEGFLSKNVRSEALLSSLRGVLQGEVAVSRRMTARVFSEFARLAQIERGQMDGLLTARETEILGHLCGGQCNKEIAQELYISENTVKAHVARVYKKLHLHSRAEAAAYARRLGICRETHPGE